MEELLIRIFGEYTYVDLISFGWFMFIGYAVNALIETSTRDIDSPNTPKKWYWYFWIRDNWKRYLFTVLMTYVLFRFYIEIIGHPFTDFEALLLGFSGDGVSGTLKKRLKLLSADRKKIMNKIEISEKNHERII
jgi:hypothetical protein